MRIGIFSDAHGNIYAFDKVWEHLEREACDAHCFLGDICGYYYFQNEVVDFFRAHKDIICLGGNHDEMFLRGLEDAQAAKDYLKRYGKANELLAKNIKPSTLDFLKGLSPAHIWEEENIALYHGSPAAPWDQYIYPTTPIDQFAGLPYKYVLLGHTHHPMDRSAGVVRIINPGSCGQPRDYNWASYAVLDTQKNTVAFRRVEYDRASLIRDVESHNENSAYLIDVLNRKKPE